MEPPGASLLASTLVPKSSLTRAVPAPPMSLEHRDLVGGEFWQGVQGYRDVSADTFSDWQWQGRNSVRSISELQSTLGGRLSDKLVEDLEAGLAWAPMAVRLTPYVVSLIDWDQVETDPIRRQFLPLGSQCLPDHPATRLDALSERACSPVSGLVHRYPDRVLLLALDNCPVYCRFCTRSYAIGGDTTTVQKDRPGPRSGRLKQAIDYIATHPQVEDVVVSGGDLFMLRGADLRALGESLLRIEHVRRIRLATKGLAVMPMKILSDDAWFGAVAHLVELGRSMGKEVFVHTHIAHPNEITDLTQQAVRRLWNTGATVRNQAVVLRGVNDNAKVLTTLLRKLAHILVEPYYMYQHDIVPGVEDLRTRLGETLELEREVRGSLAGFNMPTFVVDLPGGGGKRDVHSFDFYDRETGVAVYRSPAVDPRRRFVHFDPLDKLSESMQERWREPGAAESLIREALDAALDTRPYRGDA